MRIYSNLITFRLLFLAFLVLVSSRALAEASCTPSSANTHYIYVNGVGNPSPDNADSGAASLSQAISFHLPNGTQTAPHVDAFWSPSDDGNSKFPIFDALAAASLQKWGGIFLDFVSGVLNSGTHAEGDNLINLRKQFADTQRPFIDELKLRLRADLADGKKIVLLAHSRGNLLVDTALQELRVDLAKEKNPGMSSIGLVNIASPDIEPKPGDPPNADYSLHITRSDDTIIRPIPGSLPANFTPVKTVGSSTLNHLIDDDYLGVDIVDANGQTIQNAVVSAINSVTESVESCGLQLLIAPSASTVEAGKTIQFSLVVTNSGRTTASLPPNVTWSSLGTDIATIASSNTIDNVSTAQVYGVLAGASTAIIATDNVTKKSVSATVTVIELAPIVPSNSSNPTRSCDHACNLYLKVSPNPLNLETGEVRMLNAKLFDSKGGNVSSNNGITWTSLDKSVATIDQSGNVFAVAKISAQASITAEDNTTGAKGSIMLQVFPLPVYESTCNFPSSNSIPIIQTTLFRSFYTEYFVNENTYCNPEATYKNNFENDISATTTVIKQPEHGKLNQQNYPDGSFSYDYVPNPYYVGLDDYTISTSYVSRKDTRTGQLNYRVTVTGPSSAK